MAPWLVPALKAVLPHLGTIISAAVPVFTQKPPATTKDQTAFLQQQITELQTAASQNADNIRELAEQLQSTVTALEQSAAIAETRLRRVFLYSFAAAVVSTITLGFALYLILTR
jgi:hypothetical protein